MFKSMVAAAVVCLPALAFAGPSNDRAPDPARRAQIEKRIQTARTIGLADALGLDVQTAMQLDARMASFDARRQPIHTQLRESHKILKAAAQGDAAAAKQVDGAIDQAFKARAQLQQLDREMIDQVSEGMPPQEKAKFVVFLAHFKRQMVQQFMGHDRHGRHGRHGAMRGEGADAPAP